MWKVLRSQINFPAYKYLRGTDCLLEDPRPMHVPSPDSPARTLSHVWQLYRSEENTGPAPHCLPQMFVSSARRSDAIRRHPPDDGEGVLSAGTSDRIRLPNERPTSTPAPLLSAECAQRTASLSDRTAAAAAATPTTAASESPVVFLLHLLLLQGPRVPGESFSEKKDGRTGRPSRTNRTSCGRRSRRSVV
jgi:hypothetical protein